ncbi:unnamed protein product [Polarella glacialis]|uniref:30S ribosomal protein S11 n=1 Tax=Polarella glacialis TaxID=89957 RepID=A0A813JJI7_POLGL|nr:unnamed protein product [Polarella glacialis]CAE8698738.1 unnamed protein product [Polarella glacialis]
MSRLAALALVASQLMLPVAAFLAPQPGAVRLPSALPSAGRSLRAPAAAAQGSAEAAFGYSGAAALVGAAVCLGAARSLRRTALSALGTKPERLATGCILTINKMKNNTHVALTDNKGHVIWGTSEKRYGKLLPNANRAVEAAIFVAEKLNVDNVVLKVKGLPTALGSIITTIRGTGMNVSQALVMNNIRYGGCRPKGIRR